MRRFMITALVVAASLAGCLGGESGEGQNLAVIPELTSYTDRQTAAHPAFGYPTYTDYGGLNGEPVPDAWMPPAAIEVPEVITGIEHVATAEGVTAGAGIAVFGHYAIVSGSGPGAIVDIADPLNPVKVADLDISVRDADIIAYPDGRLVAVMASNGPIHVFDITDPTAPIQLPSLEVGSHNAVVVPGTPIVYNANSRGGASNGIAGPEATLGMGVGVTEIIDLTDPENPVYLEDFANGYGCHDITTYIDPVEQKYRAYCAGIEMTQIWDISDPRAPTVIANVPVHHGVAGAPSGSVFLAMFSHLAMVNSDASILIVGDETFGGIGPGCSGTADTGVASSSGPLGNLWFYDISDETNPVLQGWISPNQSYIADNPPEGEPGAGTVFSLSCTAHFGRLIEDRDVLAIGFYRAGVLLIDFSNPAAPEIAAQYNTGANVWDTWFWQGYLFTGDLNKGLEVLKLV